MDQSLCKLTLVYPASIADPLIELILGVDPPVRGFTTFAAEGHGFDLSKSSVRERVRGCVERHVLMAVMPRARASQLLEVLRTQMPVPHMAYWLEPVIEAGRMTDAFTHPTEAQEGGLP